jgi:hypothetical protein
MKARRFPVSGRSFSGSLSPIIAEERTVMHHTASLNSGCVIKIAHMREFSSDARLTHRRKGFGHFILPRARGVASRIPRHKNGSIKMRRAERHIVATLRMAAFVLSERRGLGAVGAMFR